MNDMKWINIKDRLPSNTQPVEFRGSGYFHQSENATVKSLGFIGKICWERDNGLQNAITHWRPLSKKTKDVG